MVVNVVGFAMVSPPSTTELSPMNVSYRKTVKNDTESGSDISTSSSELSRGSSASLQANLMDAQFQLLTAQIPAVSRLSSADMSALLLARLKELREERLNAPARDLLSRLQSRTVLIDVMNGDMQGGDVEFGRDDEEDLLPAADELVTQEDLAVVSDGEDDTHPNDVNADYDGPRLVSLYLLMAEHIGRGVTRTTFTFWFEVYGVYHCASEL
ncbi:hypothetical protein JG687_00019210 [Phytophthora cactorum]|uniref:Uncharacterized protein n=1 Tax=Phytophthora cactorum TaxID=29920 RepID=A0A329RDD8_9STRA|nr:hypothetical protein Pcac1_g20339 [Phytophthora cactorum]KAG3217006.1 hypothetical protein PC129_g12154 [Phytophthora cactorum]KAG6942178.1 hypothetical protein JG687_00019210 [Phytophthora cactorum]RAW22059.1 hypothetical protein PC110_g21499 [Phytophthora cactorum]